MSRRDALFAPHSKPIFMHDQAYRSSFDAMFNRPLGDTDFVAWALADLTSRFVVIEAVRTIDVFRPADAELGGAPLLTISRMTLTPRSPELFRLIREQVRRRAASS